MGIGRAIADNFAREGCNLVLVSRTALQLEEVKRILSRLPVRVEIFAGDVSEEQDVGNLVKFAVENFNTIDILVNCAGIYGPIGVITDINSKDWLKTLTINLYGTFVCIKGVLPIMMKQRKGKIINLSGGGATSPFPRFSAYGVSKAGVVRLTETLAEEVKEYGIDINAIAPGAVNTRLLDQVLEVGEAAGKDFLDKAIRQKEEGGVPPEKVAELALFLASPQSDGLTGKLVSLLWDNWQEIPQHLLEIMTSDIYTLRRIVPKDRGYDW